MFDRIVYTGLRKRAAHRSAYIFVAAVTQSLVVAAMAVATAKLAAPATRETVVEVQLPRMAPRPPPPPPPAAAGVGRRRPAPGERRVVKPPSPTALVQPREVLPEMKAADASEPVEEYDYEGGAEGGVVGGVPGAEQWRGEARGGGGGIEEAPQYALTGFRKPAEAEPGCVRGAIRMPTELAGFVSGPITVKFAVGRDGRVGLVQFLTAVPDPRIEQAVRQGLRACRWIPGADAQGRPTALWVVLPIRFEIG